MKNSSKDIMHRYRQAYSFLDVIENDIWNAADILTECFYNGGKLLLCGNGGSNADADHIAGELVKGFKKKRSLPNAVIEEIGKKWDDLKVLGGKLQQGLPAINLGAQTSVITATINDIGAEAIFAQQILAYGSKNDVLLGISTSGNSRNVINAMIVAKQRGIYTVGLTGEGGGALRGNVDCSIRVPSNETATIQEMHTPVYHVLCEIVENEFWDE